ncbi:MAG: sulfatase-like hydrolase/transferase [Planctomycetota bacterium]
MGERIVRAWFALLIGSAATAVAAPQGTTSPPNVVVLIADDLGYGDLGCYGSPVIATPRIDALAAEGARFESFYVHPACTPTRAAMLTGRYASRVGIVSPIGSWSPLGLSPDETTVAEVLASGGYRTAHFGKWHVGDSPDQQPTAQGFDEFSGLLWGPTGLPLVWVDSRAGTEEFEPDQRFDTQRVTTEALDFIDRAHADGDPFFCIVSYTTPHEPATASAGFVGISADGRAYGDAVEEMDAAVGSVVDRLDLLGVADSTLVLFLSDNGAKAGGDPYQRGSNLPLFGGKGSTWEGGVRVPAVARMPGVVLPGHVVEDPASITDLLPTFADLAGVALPPSLDLDGRSVVDLLGGAQGDPARFVHFIRADDVEAVRRGRYKLRFGALFDVVTDPGESVDLAAALPVVAADLQAELDSIRADIAANGRPAAVSKRVERRWRAGLGDPGPFVDGTLWRSVTIDGTMLRLEDADPVVDLASISILGEGNTSLPRRAHRLVAASDEIRWTAPSVPIAADAPFSIAFWYRGAVDEPDRDLALVDFGDDLAGLSITLGDAGELGDDPGPGRRDDLLVRIGGSASPSSGTVAVDLPGDPSQRFVHVVVTRDAVGDVAVHLDGFERARVSAPGADWAPGRPWSLLAPIGALGGSGGPGVLPFDADSALGDLAGFGVWDRALRRNEVESQYCRYVTYPFCTGGVNTSGRDARLSFRGSFVQADERLFVRVVNAVPSTVGFLLASPQQTRFPVASGNFCLASPFQRLSRQVFGFDADGSFEELLDWSLAPPGLDTVSTPTWNFQCWYRDGFDSNFSNGTLVLFCR